ncbi:hypothetical protein AgCh_005215 [Apium graveolens]
MVVEGVVWMIRSLTQNRIRESSLDGVVAQRKAKTIDLVDEDAAKLKMEITSKPTELDEIELDEIDRAILKMEMELLVLL